ncbi:hypothetical protein D9613_001922 [Agrocybe pediades]|uniref:Uncharacterized protein n=1 Tax=Agrocybe pediades TaxID=84607 RepID=A0A8H4R8G0_9AGAR|nr:hypothetical protein D9613_001922 [Agrocybe pediades]
MSPLPSRDSLEAMKRTDIQRICKERGIRANMKTDALIDMLLGIQPAPTPTPTPAPAKTPTPAPMSQPVRRSVSTRAASKAGPSRISSMIVHDIPEEDEEEDIPPPPEPPIIVPTRTRKAKELQTRLGVGKPIIAGGRGPRAVTRSSGSSRGKREKLSKSIKPMESTIEEEPENTSTIVSKVASPSHVPQKSPSLPPIPNDAPGLDVRKLVEEATRSFQEQINALKAELTQMNAMRAEIDELRAQIGGVRKDYQDAMPDADILHETASEVEVLRGEIKQLKMDLAANKPPARPSTPKGKSSQTIGLGFPSSQNVAQSSISLQPDKGPNAGPGLSENVLGKRARDSRETSVEQEGVGDGEGRDGQTNKEDRPIKKKAKLTGGDATARQADDQEQGTSTRPTPAFTVFQGAEEPLDYTDPPPPTEHLPDFFHVDSTPPDPTSANYGSTKPTLPSANGAENQPQAFGFSYLPISSTPNGMYMPTFPYPEPPQSPSPAGPSTGPFLGRHFDERTDIFKPFGLPSPLKSGRHYGSLQDDRGGFVNPAALLQTGSSGKLTSNEVAAGLGLVNVRTTSSTDPGPVDPPPPTTKRTMYGTELDGDTRFGDFGVEGVASGFWTNRKL